MMTKPTPTDFFTKEASESYDERNRKLASISENMHFLMRLILEDLPTTSRVLCVGVGTGAEMLSLGKANPEWTFVGVDPSASMLEVCTKRLKDAGMANRCQLIHGYIDNVPEGASFDAAVSVLVAHFIPQDQRLAFFKSMVSRLKNNGYLINTEISFDLDSKDFPEMLHQWKKIQALMGGTPESLAKLPDLMRQVLTVLPPAQTKSLLLESGITEPLLFFRSFMIDGWYGIKGPA